MALHKVKLPKEARELRSIVKMQRTLLEALCTESIDISRIDRDWLATVWKAQDAQWLKKFCRKEKFSIIEPIKEIASASLIARQEIYSEFCTQHKFGCPYFTGGKIHLLEDLDNVSKDLAAAVHKLFKRFYDFLGHNTGKNWEGYLFPQNRKINKKLYTESLEHINQKTMTVCPYCDGSNDEPELDHYYAKESFPLLSCSPWNLVPVCHYCNKIGAKGSQVAITINGKQQTRGWLHPFFRPASSHITIRLSGRPNKSIPQLHSPDPEEQLSLENHAKLIQTLEKRWTKKAASYHDVLVRKVNRKREKKPWLTIDDIVQENLEEHQESCGTMAYSMIHAAVCQAILDRRPGYIEEFTDSNPPMLD